MCPVTEVAREIGRLSRMVEEMGTQGIDRATFLRGALGMGLSPVLGSLLAYDVGPDIWHRFGDGLDGRRSLDSESAATYAAIARAQQRLYWSSPPTSLHELARSHAHLGARLLRSSTSAEVREQLARAVGESALLCGRLASFDLSDAVAARQAYGFALAASREAGDHPLAVGALAHAAFLPAFTGDYAAARALVAAARAHAGHGVGPLTRSWLHCVASEVEARAGEHARARHEIDLAEEALHGSGHEPAWLDFYNPSRLDGFAG